MSNVQSFPVNTRLNGEPLGEEDYPVKYNIWIANDNRVIKCEPMNYLHNEFTYQVGQFVYDNNVLMSAGLSDVIDQLQSVISWFINSRITNVRKVISDKLIVNTSMVNMSDLQNRRPVIRLTGAATGEINRYIKQLQLQDVTIQHIADVKSLHDILKMVTGINDSLLGEVRPGRRSATENRNTTTGFASRLKTIAAIIFRSALEPLGRQMLSNLRDGLDEETYVKVMNSKAQITPEFIKVTKENLIGHYDFEVFDGTLPSDRFHIAQALDELLQALMFNPQAAMYMGLDPKKLLMESLQLRGVRNPERFALQQEPNPNVIQPNNNPGVAGESGGTTAGTPGAIPESLLPLFAGATGGGGSSSNGGGIPAAGTR